VAKPAASPAAKPAFDEKAVADFYRGKTIRLITGGSAGGGYDIYSRFIARYIGKFIPGNPNVIVENMPGAGMVPAANHLYGVAAKDGTVIGNVSVGVVVQQMLGNPAVQFDSAKFNYLGLPALDYSLCWATKASGFKSLVETIGPDGKEFVIGSNAPGSAFEDDPKVLREALGAKLKIISGYKGTAEVLLAMDQGEVQGICGLSIGSGKAGTAWEKVQSGDYVVISQNTEAPLKELPGVPTAFELAKTAEARQLIHYGITLISHVQRQFLTPPDVPAERVAALREAFAKTLADKEFLADAEKGKLDISPMTWQQAEQFVRELVTMPAAVKARLQPVLQPGGQSK
jgi:tripartite-type tricarboxylate transporter receptor subunit TctC